ncbi:unnamed protein product, partial [marine sediment metagenome]
GSPSPHTIDAVGAYVPAILGTLTIIPVYFIGKELFNRWVGILAAALVAILPGEFLNRSLVYGEGGIKRFLADLSLSYSPTW